MKPLQTVTIFAIAMLSQVLVAAQSLEFSGQVIDSETHEPIPFAHLALVGTHTGTSSNQNGHYSLKLNNRDDLQIQVSSIGYNTLTISLKPDNRIQNILLEPAVVQLESVIINAIPESPRDIVEKAVKQISLNYPIGPYFLTGYYKESENTEGNPIYIAEAVVQAAIPKADSEDEMTIRLLKSRKSVFRKGIAFKNKLTPGGFYLLLESSIVDPIDPMVIKRMKHYTFSKIGFTKFQGRDMIVIGFTDGHKRQPHSGKFTIDLESYAFVRIEQYKVHGPGLPTDDWKWTYKSFDEQFVLGADKLWHLSSSIFIGDWIKKKSNQEFQTKRLLIPTDRSTTDRYQGVGLEFDREKELYFKASNSDPTFWENYNYIELLENEKRAMQRIKDLRDRTVEN